MVALAGGPSSTLVLLDPTGEPDGRRIELPAGASRLASSADGASLYVSGSGPQGAWLARVDLPRGVSRVVPLPAGHGAIAVWPDGTRPAMWFSNSLGDKNNPGP